jgi:methionyl-tRNA formyltransferase
MTKSKTLVFFGNERLATSVSTTAPTLRALIDAGYNIAAVVSHFTPGRSRAARSLEIETIAKQHHVPVLLPNKTTDVAEQLEAMRPEAAVLVAYGKIVPQNIIDLFPAGIINIHPSLLPKYRGPTPIEQVILDGAPKTGASLMRLSKEMDAGPVYAQAELLLRGAETKQELADTLLQQGGNMLLEHLPAILDGSMQPTSQDNTKATYCSLLTKEMGIIKPESYTATEIERQVRAYFGFPKSQLTVNKKSIIVTKVKVISENTPKTLIVACKQNTFLEILELIGPNGRTMSGQAFCNGYLAN